MNYLIRVGDADRARLDAQDAVLNPISLGFVQQYGSLAGKTVVDVGCGQGGLTIEIARLAERVIAVDASIKQIAIAKERAEREGITNIEFVVGDVSNLSKLVPESDVVHCRWLLAHVRNPRKALEEMQGSLKPGGRIFLEEPGGNEYRCSPNEPWAFTLWKVMVTVQHWLQRSDRSVAKTRMFDIAKLFDDVECVNPPIEGMKSKYRLGVEQARSYLPRWFFPADWWVAAIRQWEEDPLSNVTSHSFYQITGKK